MKAATSKYKAGDALFVLEDNAVVRKQVTAIVVICETNIYYYFGSYNYCSKIEGANELIAEENVFRSKEGLLKSL